MQLPPPPELPPDDELLLDASSPPPPGDASSPVTESSPVLPLLLPLLPPDPELPLLLRPDPDEPELLVPLPFVSDVDDEFSLLLPLQATIVTHEARSMWDANKPIFMMFLRYRVEFDCHDDLRVASDHH